MDFNNSLNQFLYQNYLINKSLEEVAPNLERALDFYRKHLLETDRELDPLLRIYNFKSQLPSWKWEMFAAILVGDVGANTGKSKNGKGADLVNHEVKSALSGNSFEYQYHRKSWREKLDRETQIGHLYISYWPGYGDLDVRFVAGEALADLFRGWEPKVRAAYETPDGKPKTRSKQKKSPDQAGSGRVENSSEKAEDRCRFSIPHKTVVERGSAILKIRGERPVEVKKPGLI